MATRWARVARGLAAATIAVFVAAFAHVAGGGQLPSLAGIALAFAFCALGCIALAGRRVSRWRVAVSVALSQGAFHVLFLLTTGSHGSVTLPASGMSMPGSATSIHLSATSAAAMPDNGWMWLAHGLAALLTTVALLRGETAFWGLYETTRLALTRALRPPTLLPQPAPTALPRASFDGGDRRSAHFLLTGLRHRGPPRAVLASA